MPSLARNFGVYSHHVVETSLSDLDYTDLKSSDRKEDARLSQID